MKAFAKLALMQLLVLLLSVSVAFAQAPPPAPPKAPATQPELDQMLAPIALYPDSLLSQILMASTYPLEVVEAARWSRTNPGLKGSDAVGAADQKDWDPSVKSLTAFPQVLAMMDQHLEWTERLGDVFIAQEPQVMETVQTLRQKAYAAGNLRSTEQAYVYPQGEVIAIEPASPEVVYVPYYDPQVVYGTWWWPAYPPVYWARWPGYYAYPGYAPGFAWGVGIPVGAGFFFSACDWRARHVTVVNVTHVTNVTVNRQVIVNPTTPVRTTPAVWRHDPAHRRGVPYHIASLQKQLGPANAAPANQRLDSHWRDSLAPATRNSSLNRPEANNTVPNVPGARSIPRRAEDARTARPEGRGGSFVPPGAARDTETRPESRGSVGRPPVPPVAAVPQPSLNPGKVPQPQAYAPRPVVREAFGRPPEAHGVGDHRQGGNHRAPPAAKAHGEGRGR